jgi:hypothetical protein
MPQATIKLQVAPKPAAAARKSEEGSVKPADSSLKMPETASVRPTSNAAVITPGEEGEYALPEVPLPIALAAAALALGAVAIQIWTFIS